MAHSEFYEARSTFFRALYSGTEGYVVLATMNSSMGDFREEFYSWPDQRNEFLNRIEELSSRNLYYCPQVFSEPKRAKKTVAYTTCAWADLDDCSPEQLLIMPTIVIESSAEKYQGLWLFENFDTDPLRAENISRRIAAVHKSQGADHCWNLGRLLRIPYTMNYKYAPPQLVTIAQTGAGGRFSLGEFDVFPQVQGNEYLDVPFPDELPDETAEEILQEHRYEVGDRALELFQFKPPPGESWSHPLWSLMMLLLEGELTREQVFIVANEAACNKFRRDGKPPEYLWSDVCRAFFRHKFNVGVIRPPTVEEELPLLSDGELNRIEQRETWVERYIRWASGLGDAAVQYHQAGAFVSLSALLAGSIRLPTSFGTVIPNLWFMILADTTLTRKTTSMDITMDLAAEIDPNILLATDGSLEGLFTALSTRPGQPSVFLRDEFSGLLEAMNKRDYMAGFAEALTKLYDGKVQKRVLRKEVIQVKDPVVIMYTGGIRSKVQEILTEEQIASGFLPRFIFITAESDVTKVQPLGPPTEKNWGARSELLEELRGISLNYTGVEQVKIQDKLVTTMNKRVWKAELTPEAWTRYNQLESEMMQSGVRSEKPEVFTPLWDRLSKSMLKAAVLIAASRQAGVERVTVTLDDILHAMRYGQDWKYYAKEVVINVGHSRDEKHIQTLYGAIIRSAGISRSALMQAYHLSARDANQVLETLEQRGLIIRTRVGRTEMIKPRTGSEEDEA